MKVQCHDVSVQLGDVEVLTGVNLRASPGELVGLIGPNGAGKTTLLRTINGIQPPAGGAVRIGDAKVSELGRTALSRRVATVPQRTHLDFAFSVREVVEMGRHPYRHWNPLRAGDSNDEIVDQAMVRTGVADLADRPITAVSGGERQRVLLARAIAQATPVTLLDEPTASLDVTHAVRTLAMARDLADAGRTVVAAIHDLNLAAEYCDRLALMADGQVRAVGRPEEVLDSERLTVAFGGDVVVARDPVTDAPLVQALPNREERQRSGHVHVVGGDGSAASLLAPLVRAGYRVSVGIVPEGSRSVLAAEALGCEVVTAPPFAMPGTARSRARDLVASADVVVLAPVETAAGLGGNIELAAEGKSVIVVDGEDAVATTAGGPSLPETLQEGAADPVAPGALVSAVANQLPLNREAPTQDPVAADGGRKS